MVAFRHVVTAATIGLISSVFPLSLSAGTQAEIAIQQVKKLISSGEIKQGEVLSIVAKQGNIANFLGKDLQLKEQWQLQTGTLIDAKTMPQNASLSFIKNAENVDLTIARNREYPDLAYQDLIEDLTPLAQRFGYSLVADQDLILPMQQATYNGQHIAMPADGDLAVLYLRKDLIDDPVQQKEFFDKYSKKLQTPKTWDDYLELVEFFDRSDEGFYGSLEQRDEASGWMFWMLRYASQKYPNQYLFDENMTPLVNSEAGWNATRNYVATVPFSPQGILDSKNNYTFTLPKFLNGQGFSTIITLAGAKIFNLDHSKVKGKYVAVPVPGKRFEGGINRRSTLIYGNNIVIPKRSKNKELAFLFSMWLTDPDISTLALNAKGGFSDPYRFSHFNAPQMQRVYGKQVLSTVKGDLPYIVPAGTGLPGDSEYIAVLNEQIHLAAQGIKTAQQAMKAVEQSWQEITDRYGRESQIAIWRKVRELYPQE